MDLQLLPHNLEAETSILGAIFISPDSLSKIADTLPPEAFVSYAHKEIYRVCLSLYRKGTSPDLISISNKLQAKGLLDKVGGLEYLTQIAQSTVSAVNIDRYALLILEKYVRRQVIEGANELTEVAKDQVWEPEQLFSFFDRTVERIKSYQEILAPSKQSEYNAYLKLVKEIKEIEQGEPDPGFKLYRLKKLAQSSGHDLRHLNNLYLKYLASQENEAPMTLGELKAKYGSTIQEWYLHGFGPKGSVVLLHAHGGVGKTRLVYDWIYSMVQGIPWEGHPVTAESRRVLIVQTDESQGDMINALESRGFTDGMPLKVKTRWTAEHMASLRADIESFKPEVILIDSLTSINRNCLFSENDTEYARPVLELRDIAQEFGCLIYLIHHSNSEGGSRGTKAIAASVSHVFSFKRASDQADPTSPRRILAIDKSRSRAPGKYTLEFNPDTGGWQFLGEVDSKEDNAVLSLKDKILQYLGDRPNTRFTAQEIQSDTGGESASVRKALNQLAQDGMISRQRENQRSPYLYWLAYLGDPQKNEWITNGSPMDHQTWITNGTVTGQGLQPTKNFADPLHCKNAEKPEVLNSGKNAEEWITKKNDSPQTLTEQASDLVIQVGDPLVIQQKTVDQQETVDQQTVNNWVEIGPRKLQPGDWVYSAEFGAVQVVNRLAADQVRIEVDGVKRSVPRASLTHYWQS